jgi:hypothetical protein
MWHVYQPLCQMLASGRKGAFEQESLGPPGVAVLSATAHWGFSATTV